MSTASAPIEQYAQFDPSKHPRGQPENAGEFAPKGSGSTNPSAKPDDSGGEQPDAGEPQKVPSPQQGQPEQPQPQQPPPQPEDQSQEVIHVSAMNDMPKEAQVGFEDHVLSPLRNQVSELDKIASNPMLGKRYAWEAATHRGEKPGDPHAGSASLERWKGHATMAGYNADEAITSHPELNDLTARLDKHRGWGTERSGRPSPQPEPQQVPPEQRYADLLKQAEPYRQPGENYSRNIHAPANRLEHSMQAGHSPNQLKMAADELEQRLKLASPIATESEDQALSGPPSQQSGPKPDANPETVDRATIRGTGYAMQQFPHGATDDQVRNVAKVNWANNDDARRSFASMDHFADHVLKDYQSKQQAFQDRERRKAYPEQYPTEASTQGDKVKRVSKEEVFESPEWDTWHAGMGSERMMAKAADGMQGIEGREYAIREHSPGKWQIISRKQQEKPAQAEAPAEEPAPEVPAPEPQKEPAEEPFALQPTKNAPKQEEIPITGGQQQSLFPKAGMPGQMNLFAEKGVPDAMLPKHLRQPDGGPAEVAPEPSPVESVKAEPVAEQPPEPSPEPQPQAPEQSADEPDELDDRGHASNWNEVIKDHGKASPKQLKHALRTVEHMRQHHASNAALTPEQRTAITSLLDSHHAKIQQALSAHEKPQAPSEQPNAAESSPAPSKPKTGGSVTERHSAARDKIDLAPSPVKDLLRSLHSLRDTKRNGHVQTKELGADYAKEMYDHLKSNKRSGDGFGDVHDMSAELGHGAMGYSSPAGNIAIVPPKFKNDDYDVRYTLPHESQDAQESVAEQPPEQTSPDAEPESIDEPVSASEGFPWEQDSPEPELKDGKPVEHWQALAKLKESGFNDKRKPIGRKIAEMVGDDPIEQHGMHQAVLQTHRDLNRQIADRNHAYTSLLGQFLGKDPLARTKFINAAKAIEKRGGDYTQIPHFDEMVTMVQNSPEEYGSLLQQGTFNRTDISQQLMDRFIRDEGGLEKELSMADDDVLSEAASRLHHGTIEFAPDDPYVSHQKKRSEQEHARRMRVDPHYRDIWEQHQADMDAVPFSRSGPKLRYEKIRRWLSASYNRWRKYARQLGFAWGAAEEALHPRAPGGEWTDKEGHAPGAPAPHAAKPASAPAGFKDMPLFSQVPPVSPPPPQPAPQPAPSPPVQKIEQPPAQPVASPEPQAVDQPQQVPEEPVSVESTPEAEQPPAPAEPSQEGEPPVPTVEQQDARMERAMSKREQVNQFMVAKYQETGDSTILDQLLEDNLPLIRKAASRYARNPTELDDYMQQARIGFFKAIDKFDPTKGMSFAGYASKHISNGLNFQHRFFHPGERSKDEAKRTKTISASQLPPDDDVPSSMEQLVMATGRRPSRPMEHLELQAELKQTLQEEFSDRDADVIQMRFGIGPYKNNPHEYPEIAQKLGIGTEGARQIIKRAAPALQRRLKAHWDPEDYAKSASEAKDVTEQDWRDATEKYGLSWDRCFQRGEPERYGMLDGQDAHVIAQALAEWYWNLPDRRDREKADHYAKQLGFNFGDAPPAPAPAAKPATAPSGGGWGSSQEQVHPRATEPVTIAGKTYSGGQWIPKDQAAQATPAEKSKIELVSKSEPASPLEAGAPKNAKTDIHSAFEKIIAGDRKSSLGQGHTTLVSMEDLRRHLPQYSPDELNAEIRKLRESGTYTMETAHGRTTPEMREAGIKEGSDNLIWIARR